MNRNLYRIEHWLRMNFWRWLPAALVLGIVLACAAHGRDTPRFVVPVAGAAGMVRG